MSTKFEKYCLDTADIDDLSKGLDIGVGSIDADEQITSLKSDYEALKKKINDIESKSLQLIITLQTQLQNEKEQLEKVEKIVEREKPLNILNTLNSQETITPSFDSTKEKDEKIRQLEESYRHLEESNKLKDEEIQRKDEESAALKAENSILKKEIEKIKLEYPQVIPHEFNVVNSLAGLGPDILLLILSKMIHIQNAIQLLGINQKMMNLKNHDRFFSIIEKLNRNISIHNPDPDDIELSDVDVTMKRISKKQTKNNTVSLTQVLEDGIWQLETWFNNSNNADAGIGIVQDSYEIPARTNPTSVPHTQNMAIFLGKQWDNQLFFNGIGTKGMCGFGDNQILRLEFDSKKGTLFLFVDNIQQELYISGIKEKIYTYCKNSQCTIRSLKKLSAPTSGQVPNEIKVKW